MASSALYASEFIIDDFTAAELEAAPAGCGRGLELGRGSADYEYGASAEPFPKELLIPRDQWQARIQELEARKERLSDLMRFNKLPAKNQARLNYCWIFSPTHCLEIMRMLQNQEYVSLSPASAGAQIKNFRNTGGWGREALQWISDKGVCPSAVWPDTALDRGLVTPENAALALNYRTPEWWELRPRNLDEKVSCLLRRIPVSSGYNWWSHQTTSCDPLWLDGEIAIRDRNQWPNYGDDNYFVLRGSKMYADDQVAPRTAVAA